jgi:small subunit ribosomal protein S6
LLLDPETAEERQSEIVVRARDLVEKGGGSWRSHDSWGRRKLAYEIGHKGEAHYHLLVFETEPETLDELTRILKITDNVMRHMAVRHVEGSRTSAPREESFAPAREERPPRDDDRSRSYASANTRSEEEEE